MNRREMIKTSGFGVGSLALTGAAGGAFGFAVIPDPACNPKNLSGWVVTIVADFGEIKPLLGELGLSTATVSRLSALIDKGASIAKAFDDAYKASDFKNAVTLFTSLGGIISQVAADLNVTDNRIVKLLLVGIQIARITIASLLDKQAAGTPAAQNAMANVPVGTPESKAVAEVKRLASIDVSGILAAIQ
jgi:hypothetical protein